MADRDLRGMRELIWHQGWSSFQDSMVIGFAIQACCTTDGFEIQACWYHGWKPKNKVFKIWWLALRFRLAANAIQRIWCLDVTFCSGLHKLFHATQARPNYTNSSKLHRFVELPQNTIFAFRWCPLLNDAAPSRGRHAKKSVFSDALFIRRFRDLPSRSRACQYVSAHVAAVVFFLNLIRRLLWNFRERWSIGQVVEYVI